MIFKIDVFISLLISYLGKTTFFICEDTYLFSCNRGISVSNKELALQERFNL